LIARRVVIGGRVQGVFFRETCRREAAGRGVAGWVRNRPDGRVDAVFEGPEEAVDAMVAWCRHGPRGAAVVAVEVTSEPPQGLQGFRIAPST
jgi:acylphosphatase